MDVEELIERESIQEDWTILDIVKKHPPSGWKDLFSEELYQNYQDVDEFLSDKKFYPLKKNLFRALEITSLKMVKVVIIGMDPYYTNSMIDNVETPTGQGLCFSVHKKDKIPPSLNNIFKEMIDTKVIDKFPEHGDLTRWAMQGCLLLNACLTVFPGSSGNNKKIWEFFVKKVITLINENNPKTVFILWGNKAKELSKYISDSNIIIEGAHPSPLSAKFFFGGDYFNKTNSYLKKYNKKEIKW